MNSLIIIIHAEEMPFIKQVSSVQILRKATIHCFMVMICMLTSELA
jgi:hypothetical protein